MLLKVECKIHGSTKGFQGKDEIKRCSLCETAKVRKRSQLVRKILLQEEGNSCKNCGYSGIALQFHHVNPKTKDFNVGTGTRGIERQRKEAKKCILLCANCHYEEHHRPLTPER